MGLSLIPAVGERPHPILEFRAESFLLSQLGRNLPIGYSFTTLASNSLRRRTCTGCRIFDDRVIRYRPIAVLTNDLVSHFISLNSFVASKLGLNMSTQDARHFFVQLLDVYQEVACTFVCILLRTLFCILAQEPNGSFVIG